MPCASRRGLPNQLDGQSKSAKSAACRDRRLVSLGMGHPDRCCHSRSAEYTPDMARMARNLLGRHGKSWEPMTPV